jgi:hypothetical protein
MKEENQGCLYSRQEGQHHDHVSILLPCYLRSNGLYAMPCNQVTGLANQAWWQKEGQHESPRDYDALDVAKKIDIKWDGSVAGTCVMVLYISDFVSARTLPSERVTIHQPRVEFFHLSFLHFFRCSTLLWPVCSVRDIKHNNLMRRLSLAAALPRSPGGCEEACVEGEGMDSNNTLCVEGGEGNTSYSAAAQRFPSPR